MSSGLQVGRNERCPCGSGKKFKHCCLHRTVNGSTAEALPGVLLDRSPPPRPQVARPNGGPARGGETIEATGGHPFWVISGEDLDKRPVPDHCPVEGPGAAIPGRWVNAIDLRVGDILFTRDGRRVPITNVSVRHAKMKVYNLQVEGLHNYAVGYSGVLVHNNSGPSGQTAGASREFVQVDPRTLRLPPGRIDGADPAKLARQISQHGKSTDGMPPPLVVRGKNGELQVIDGVTRSTRVGKLLPGQQITVEVIENKPNLDLSRFPTVGDKLP